MSSPPNGFYFCQPLLSSGRQLIPSNVVPLQPQSFYQQRRIRPCLISEFQNSSSPFCAQPGIMLGPNQMIFPTQTVTETVQYISPTGVMITPTPMIVQATPAACNATASNRTGLIAGVLVGVVLILILFILIIVAVLILIQIKRKKYYNSKFPKSYNSRIISNSERCKSEHNNYYYC